MLIRDDADVLLRLGSLVLFVKCLIMLPNPSNLTCTLSDPRGVHGGGEESAEGIFGPLISSGDDGGCAFDDKP